MLSTLLFDAFGLLRCVLDSHDLRPLRLGVEFSLPVMMGELGIYDTQFLSAPS